MYLQTSDNAWQPTDVPVVVPALRDKRIWLMGVPIDNLVMSEAVDAIQRHLNASSPAQVCFVNADCINIACHDASYRDVLQNAALVLPDGIGIELAGRALGRTIRDNVNGTDLFPQLCQALANSGKRLFLLGARPGIADAVRDWIARHHPGTCVAGCRHGYFTPEEEQGVIGEIAASRADLLLVAMGSPRQDFWIAKNLDRLNVRAAMGVGGLFDFYSGRIPRAPGWLRRLRLEWFFRLCQEPGRLWRRYLLGNPLFLLRVARAMIAGNHSATAR
jgi:N-acetylglucosaminyldiphosphoundecaprenol N-acetyl-beta-D-mannosaminyltransferase